MPVTVRLGGQRPEKVVHQDGQDVAVDADGNLVVSAREGRGEWVVAVYGAGSWVGAESTGSPAAAPSSR